jgi:hypothetical protein
MNNYSMPSSSTEIKNPGYIASEAIQRGYSATKQADRCLVQVSELDGEMVYLRGGRRKRRSSREYDMGSRWSDDSNDGKCCVIL